MTRQYAVYPILPTDGKAILYHLILITLTRRHTSWNKRTDLTTHGYPEITAKQSKG